MKVKVYYGKMESLEVEDKVFEIIQSKHANDITAEPAEYEEAMQIIEQLTGIPMLLECEENKFYIQGVYDENDNPIIET